METHLHHIACAASTALPDEVCSVTIAYDGSRLVLNRGPALRAELNNQKLLADGRTVGDALADSLRENLEDWIKANKEAA